MKLLFRKLGDIKGALCLHAFTSRAGISTAKQTFPAKGSYSEDRIFAPYSVYKGKAALSVTPILPTFAKLDSGGLKVDRRGTILLKFWPAVGERKYDWEKRQLFALSATEVGSLISLGPNGSCELFHDPSMQTSNAGQVRKSLSIKPHADGGGYFITLSVVNNIDKTNERFVVPVTTAEFSVMRTAFSVYYNFDITTIGHQSTETQVKKHSVLIPANDIDIRLIVYSSNVCLAPPHRLGQVHQSDAGKHDEQPIQGGFATPRFRVG